MRDVIGWTCVAILVASLALGLIVGARDAKRAGEPYTVVGVAWLLFLFLIIGAAWGLS